MESKENWTNSFPSIITLAEHMSKRQTSKIFTKSCYALVHLKPIVSSTWRCLPMSMQMLRAALVTPVWRLSKCVLSLMLFCILNFRLTSEHKSLNNECCRRYDVYVQRCLDTSDCGEAVRP